MTLTSASSDRGPELHRLLGLGKLAATAMSFLSKARRAKGSTNRLDHADVIVGLAVLGIELTQWRRQSRASTNPEVHQFALRTVPTERTSP